MNHNKTVFISFILLFLSICPNGGLPVHAAPVTVKLATMAPEGSIWMQEIEALNQELDSVTGGKVKFKIYPGGIMGDDDVVLRKMRVGQLDGALFTTNALSKMNSSYFVLTYPGLFENTSEVDHLLESQASYFTGSLREKGCEMLGIMSLGFTYAYTSTSIQTIDDMRNAKAWLWDNDPVMTSMYSHLGITPVSVGIGDVMTALQTGLLNTVFNTPTGIVSLQWYTRVKQMIDLPLTHSFGAFVLKSQAWEKIPEEIRPVVRELVQKHASEITRKTRQEDLKARDLMTKKNVTIMNPDQTLRTELRKIFSDVVVELQKSSDSAAFFKTVTDSLSQYRTPVQPS